jgi:hypothetical protein
MVHALVQIHGMLQPDGILISVHDLPYPHTVEVHSSGNVLEAGQLLDSADYEDERLAFEALARVVSDGLFLLEDEQEFYFNIHAGNIGDLQQLLTEEWETAILPDETVARVENILRRIDQEYEVVLRVPTRMTKLRVT